MTITTERHIDQNGRESTSDNCYTVDDVAGLEALPVGVRLQDKDRHINIAWRRTERGYQYGGTEKAAIFRGQHGADAMLEWGPFVILNPEILGEFWPEHEPLADWERELLYGSTPTVGDTVAIVAETTPRWNGFQAEVIRVDEMHAYLKPLSTRPDGHGRREFAWTLDRLSVVAKPEPTPLERLDALPDGTLVRLIGKGMTKAYQLRFKLRGEWWPYSNFGAVRARDCDWTASTRIYVREGFQFVVEWQP